MHPPRPDLVGEEYRRRHMMLGEMGFAYTSWSVDRDVAEGIARSYEDSARLSGQIVIFRVLVESLEEDLVFDGRVDEGEFLLEGIVEGVEFSDGLEEEDDEE